MRVRIKFSKQSALRYTGNLDVHKIWERSLRRAKLPLAYSQGFHPQPKIQLASALPLGISSRSEVLDVWFTEDVDLNQLPGMLEDAMPAGLEIINAERVDDRAPALQTQLAEAEYEVRVTEADFVSGLSGKIASLMVSRSIPRVRRGKPYDLRPLIEALTIKGTLIKMRLRARGGATGRPEEVLDELGIPRESARIERTMLIFRPTD